ncbi:S9 family peptidase [Cognaticolwellia mytili]|uniref:S9 family peptidase n=1 Tax=Cognaticolwellia mytili TaxID=1888913 RepID=UPI000A176FA6|nr:DPP IV N-terminal domain-containing protein [Cognaticolwellia mytili]
MASKVKYLSLTVVLVCLVNIAFSANAQTLNVEKYEKAEQKLVKFTDKLITGNVDYPSWSNSDQLLYRSHTEQGEQFFILDAKTKQKKLAFDHQKLATALARITEKEVNQEKLPFKSFEIVSKNKISLKVKGKAYQCNIESYLCKLTKNVAKKNELVAPNGDQAVFIRENNLWLRNINDNSEKQLTTDGIENFGYATNNAGWVRGKKPVVKWSPDSKKLTTFKHDGRNVGEMGIVSTAVGHPKIDVWKYPLPGDENIFKIHRVVIDVEQAKVTPLTMPADDHRSTITDHVAGRDGSLLDVDWSADSSHFAFVSSTRDHKTATLKMADATTGKVRTILSEVEESFFESGVSGISWKYLDKSNEIIWFSQRSDWGHLYLVDATTGKIKNQITQGDWTVLELLDINQDTGKLIFTGAGKEGGDPYFHYLYSINKDSSNLTLLTPEKKHHRITLSKDAEYFLDRVSTPNQAESSFIRSTSSKSGFVVEQMDISKLTATGWQAPTPFIVKDRNGEHDIHGLMYKPSDFDASKSYPVVNYLYPGPQVGSIRGRHFRTARGDNQAIAELGFIVIEIDALGTPGRSKSFHEFYYQNMGDSGIPDQVAAIKQLAKQHSWIDSSKVGIWGHSGGGFASTRALLTYPDFYSVAVSQAGNHDNRNYADEWGEKYHGVLVKNEDGTTNYDSQANQLIVDNLKGKLLIAHGTTDTNVPPYNTLVVVEALIEANKDFDMLMLPNRGHGFAREAYMMRKRWDYFVQHLMAVTPPKEFTFSKAK